MVRYVHYQFNTEVINTFDEITSMVDYVFIHYSIIELYVRQEHLSNFTL